MRNIYLLLILTLALTSHHCLAEPTGAQLFEKHCAACHGQGGVGIEGIAPPLSNPDLWSLLGEKGDTYIAGVMTGGMSGTLKVAGVDYRGLVMPAQSQLDSETLASIAAYVVKTLNGGVASPTANTIESLKTAPMSHQQLRLLRKGS